MFTWVLRIASIESTVGNKTRPSAFLISNSWRLILAEAFLNDHEAVYITAHRSATEENESGDYVTVPCPYKVTQHRSTADWPKI